MKKIINKMMRIAPFVMLGMASSTFANVPQTMTSLTDEELSAVEAQALFALSYIAPNDAANQGNTNIGFYTLSFDAELRLNANIRNLQLGCGGVNGYGDCDIDIQNLSFGCVANASDQCITLPKKYGLQPNGTVQEASGLIPTSTSNSTLVNAGSVGSLTQSKLRDFVIDNPFFQFALRNPENASTREIVGFRIGGAQVSGPMSFGSLNTFSGYLTGTVNLDMQEQGKGRNPDIVAVTCGPDGPDCRGNISGNSGYNTFNLTGDRTLGLANDEGCVWFICKQFRDLAVSFNGATRVATAAGSGIRLKQVQVSGLKLGSAVDGIVDSLQFEDANGLLGEDLLNIIKPLIVTQVKDKIKNQLANGLGTTVSALNNDTYQMPFNLNNVYQLDVNSTAFGIALSSTNIHYPGYAAAVGTGWSMHLPNSFTLNISEPTTRLVNRIVNGEGSSGNIAMLAAPYRNCYGTLTFC